MGKGWAIALGIVSVVGIAPFVIFLGGLGKFTDELLDWTFSRFIRQQAVMLDWYILSAQFWIVVLGIVTALANGLHRMHSAMMGFIVCNNFLLIIQVTTVINRIDILKDGQFNAQDVFGIPFPDGFDPIPYMRAQACGMVASAAFNFFILILLGLGGTSPIDYHSRQEKKGAKDAAARANAA